MSWTAPMTAVANTVFTAAQFNAHVRDNLNETAPAKATASGRIFVSTGLNAIAERAPASNIVATSQTTTSTSYADLATAGPTLTVTTGGAAMLFWTAFTKHDTVDRVSYMSIAISGATTVGASDAQALIHMLPKINVDVKSAMAHHFTLTPGSNVFTAKYKTDSGTATFADRQLFVIPL